MRDVDVIEQDGTAVGIVVVRTAFLLGDYLEVLAIAPPACMRGLGRTLLLYVERRAFSRAENFFLWVSDFNAGAQEFCRRQG